ncbi:MAG: DUF1080 domain-containing protein [Ignavibacteriales bacterium]|nr:DUF1080 domain-containing protein [Ignavibacteriales bacterium]
MPTASSRPRRTRPSGRSRDYENFVLDLEFMTAPGTNSGVIVHCSDIGRLDPELGRDPDRRRLRRGVGQAAGHLALRAIFGHLAPTKSAVRPAGEWNRYTITCAGKRIIVVLNGETVTDMDLSLWTSAKTNPDGSEIPAWLSRPKAELATKGRIGFQGKHAGAPIWFRNIRIRTAG